jgi:hypothetical protein
MAALTPRDRIRFNRYISWSLLLAAIGTILTGYLAARNIIQFALIAPYHTIFEAFFIGLLIIHIVLSLLTKFYWKQTAQKIRAGSATSLNWLKLIQRITGLTIIGLALLVVVSGLDWYVIGMSPLLPFAQHLSYDIYLIVLVIIHVGIGAKFALGRRQISGSAVNATLLVAILVPAVLVTWWDTGGTLMTLQITGTQPTLETNKVWVEDLQLSFNPAEVDTLRPDLFKPGYFSAFDVLVHLNNQGSVELEYHFNTSMNTHIIDSLNGESNWWYRIFYDAGWPEQNAFRMDHYPWKDGAWLKFFREAPTELDAIYENFRQEVNRLTANNGTVIIPHVTIDGNTIRHEFTNVTVTPHNLRNDVFQDGVITAIDVILSLGDQGFITYQLQWYETIGTAGIVKSYWVDGIDSDIAHGRCGFVYETGAQNFRLTRNHIHLPSDSRILNSPEYGFWFWICL